MSEKSEEIKKDTTAPIDVAPYMKYMSGEEIYDLRHYEIPPHDKLNMIIKALREKLRADEGNKPGVEEDLFELERVSNEAQGIVNMSWLAGIVAGLLGLAGGALLFSGGGREWANLLYPQLLCIGLPATTIGLGALGKTLSQVFLLDPIADKLVNERVKF